MEQQPNRRRWERRPFDAQLRVVVDQSKDKRVVHARGVRLSEGGICLFAAANLPVGSQVKVEFKNPRTDESVRVRGKIRNRTVYLYGVEFSPKNLKIGGALARLSADVRQRQQFPFGIDTCDGQ